MSRTIAYLGDHVALTMTKYGQKIYVDTRDISISPHILMQGDWEPWVTTAWMRAVKPGMTVVDVGANCGWFSLQACQIGAKRVYAYEPNPGLAALAQKTSAVNGYEHRWVVNNYALGAKAGKADIMLIEENQGGTQVVEKGNMTVLVQALDEVLPRDAPVHTIKIDVEGYEPEVIKGAERVLSENVLQLFIEHNKGDGEMIASLVERGFGLHHVNHQGNIVKKTIEEAIALGQAEMLYFTNQ